MDPRELRSETESRRLTVFYHGGCPDGITGAWAVYEALPESVRGLLSGLGGFFGPRGSPQVSPLAQLAQAGAVFHGIAHQDPLPDTALVAGRHLVYVDITPPAGHAAALAATAATLAVLDHHRGAREAIEALLESAAAHQKPFTLIFDEKRAGAQIAWDWAHPAEPRPEVVDYVADRDLWKWELAGSRAINKALYVEYRSASIGALAAMYRAEGAQAGDGLRRTLPGGLACRGASYLAYEEALLARLSAGAYRAQVSARLPGEDEPREYSVLALNSPCLQSELGEALMEKADPEVHFVIIWSLARVRDEIWASARTTRPDVDLSKIVPYLVGGKGGGGHPGAAGFAIAGDSPGATIRRA